ncbi:MAG: hypothetical protein LBN18_06840 [Dysgonamonadaceae bacterium]|jgi:hypothetical protein|nr:hypothetical protein [Dysgonamonadaceae bacterium]
MKRIIVLVFTSIILLQAGQAFGGQSGHGLYSSSKSQAATPVAMEGSLYAGQVAGEDTGDLRLGDRPGGDGSTGGIGQTTDAVPVGSSSGAWIVALALGYAVLRKGKKSCIL